MEEIGFKQYKYKMDKIERFFSMAILVAFVLSFNGNAGFYLFAVFTIIVLVYYFIFYRKKPDYILIKGEEFTASQGILFKSNKYNIGDIEEIQKYDKKIVIKLKQDVKLSFMKILLSDDDYNDIYEVLSRRISDDG